ncbi:unnamed protein product, partial [Gulo gulo]
KRFSAWLLQLAAQSQRPTNPKGTKRAEPLDLLSDRAWSAASTSHLPARTPSSRPRNLGLNHWGRRVHPLARCNS